MLQIKFSTPKNQRVSMDVGDDDLFAVFDSESSKSKQIVIPEEEEPTKVEKTDSESLVQEICGVRPKRQVSETEDEGVVGSKKLKTDVDTTLMTGLTDLEVKSKMEADEREVRGDAIETEQENIEEDETVVNLVEAAPR